MTKLWTAGAVVAGVLTSAGAANADDPTYETLTPSDQPAQPDKYSYAWSEPGLPSGIGMAVSVGGGVAGFTDASMRNTLSSGVGGLWDARLSIGTHIPIGVDVSYVGTAANMSTLTGAANGTLVGTTFEGALRYNMLPHYAWDPYIFAGVGWQRYDVTDVKFATSDTGVKTRDDLVEFPMGAGLSFRGLEGLIVDLRGTFRAAPDSTLVIDPATRVHASMHSWEAGGAIGYEF